ncbi:hypothetical protein Acsp04_48620 [Actinomadura sp. NBRC 104425]|uniref:DUF4253 domain-containing protein n=1 Tax=Actinomadura sp. NBRC 104425 TaxID=3032204 RepID=UPI0024A26D61|nr:DUF4253 domain-containing protein [Actinomadura sp. NBRC 104425]GLZ14627.1 hypothetical protein Acsp04_48620 [Actinomadura sp. NBRC 104425]
MSRGSLDELPDGLPPGRLITPEEADRPALWVSDEPLPDAGRHWLRLYDLRHETGLYPLLLEGLAGDPGRPWHDGELWPGSVAAIDALDAENVLEKAWHSVTEGAEHGPLSGPWPGLAPPGEADADADAAARRQAERSDCALLGLVPAERGADALTAAGWGGPCNHLGTAEVSAVVRSWENRFGARVTSVGFDILRLSVAAPPTTVEHARRVAVEHHALCPDNIWQGVGDFDQYAEFLADAESWWFWWD